MKLCSNCINFRHDYPKRMEQWRRNFAKSSERKWWGFCAPGLIDAIEPPPFYTQPVCARTDRVFGVGDEAVATSCNQERGGDSASGHCGPDGLFWERG